LRGIESDSLTARRFPAAGGDGSLTSSPPAEQLEGGEERQNSPRDDYQ